MTAYHPEEIVLMPLNESDIDALIIACLIANYAIKKMMEAAS